MSLLLVTATVYVDLLESSKSLNESLQAGSTCLELSSGIGALASLDGNASIDLNLPGTITGLDYNARIAANAARARIDYELKGTSCGISLKEVTNSLDQNSFEVDKNAVATSYNGVVTIEP